MWWIILVVLLVVIVIADIIIALNKGEKRFGKEYDGLPDEEKKKITREEYIKRKTAREEHHSTNTNVLKDKEEVMIIDCPACGEKVSNRARNCPHCGHPIDTRVYCPKCGSSNTEPISGTSKVAMTWAVGIYAANTVISKFKCKDCGHKF